MDPAAQAPPGADLIPGDMADGEPPLVVYISRRLILEEASAQNGLAIHRYGSVADEDGLVKGCVDVDVPQIPGRPLETRRAFYGEPKGDLDSALESAAEVALGHLCDEYGLIIDDWNYSALVERRQEVLVLQEKIEAAQKEMIRTKHQHHDEMVQEMEDLCLELGDRLPLRAGGPYGFEYVGPPSPTSEVDQLALGLVQLLQAPYDDE